MPGLPIIGVPVPGSQFGTIVVRKQDHKNSCVVAAPGNIVIATMGDGDTIDGEVVSEGEAVLLPNQTDLKEVGRYDVGPAGGPSVRSADFDQDSEVTNGVAVIAVLGTQAGTWVVTTADPIIVGATEIVMVQNPPGPHTHTHASTTGQGTDDHHAKLHGGDHVDGTDDVPLATTSVKGIMSAADKAKLNGINVFQASCGQNSFPADADFEFLEDWIDAFEASGGEVGICYCADGCELSTVKTITKPVYFVPAQDNGDPAEVEFFANLTVNFPDANNSGYLSFEDVGISFQLNGVKIIWADNRKAFLRIRNASKLFHRSTAFEMPASSQIEISNVVDFKCLTAGGVFLNYTTAAKVHNLFLSNIRTGLSTFSSLIATTGNDHTLNMHVLGSDLSKGFDISAATGGTVNLRRDGASDYPETNIVTGGVTLNSDRVGGDQLRETGGPTLLDVAAIPDGDFLKRSGTDVVGATLGALALLATVGTAEITDEAVTNAKLAHMVQSRIKGRAAGAGTGDATDLTVAQIKTLLAYVHADLASVGFDDHKTINTVSTTDGTQTTIETIAIPDDTVVEIIAEIVGRRTDSADRIGGRIRATVFREAAGGVVVEGVSKDFAASDGQYDLDVVGSGNDALVQVSGRAAHTLNWRSVSAQNSVA